MSKVIEVAEKFSRTPGPRYKIHGDFSGEEFRDSYLVGALRSAIDQDSVLTVVLDDVAGYGSSFLEEAFGGLLRHGFTKDQVDKHLRIEARTSRFKHHAIAAYEYIEEEAARTQLIPH